MKFLSKLMLSSVMLAGSLWAADPAEHPQDFAAHIEEQEEKKGAAAAEIRPQAAEPELCCVCMANPVKQFPDELVARIVVSRTALPYFQFEGTTRISCGHFLCSECFLDWTNTKLN